MNTRHRTSQQNILSLSAVDNCVIPFCVFRSSGETEISSAFTRSFQIPAYSLFENPRSQTIRTDACVNFETLRRTFQRSTSSSESAGTLPEVSHTTSTKSFASMVSCLFPHSHISVRIKNCTSCYLPTKAAVQAVHPEIQTLLGWTKK